MHTVTVRLLDSFHTQHSPPLPLCPTSSGWLCPQWNISGIYDLRKNSPRWTKRKLWCEIWQIFSISVLFITLQQSQTAPCGVFIDGSDSICLAVYLVAENKLKAKTRIFFFPSLFFTLLCRKHENVFWLLIVPPLNERWSLTPPVTKLNSRFFKLDHHPANTLPSPPLTFEPFHWVMTVHELRSNFPWCSERPVPTRAGSSHLFGGDRGPVCVCRLVPTSCDGGTQRAAASQINCFLRSPPLRKTSALLRPFIERDSLSTNFCKQQPFVFLALRSTFSANSTDYK